MDYGTLQTRIAEECDNRTDLGGVIYTFSQRRILFYSSVFFYSSETQDTSIQCVAGQNLYNLPSGFGNVYSMRVLLPGQAASVPTTTLNNGSPLVLPQTTITVASTTLFSASGSLFIGPAYVTYTGKTPTTFTGCFTVSSATVPDLSSVTQGAGTWVPLTKWPYDWILYNDPVEPPNQSVPAVWAPFGTTFRIFPTPSQNYRIEITGNSQPPAPTNATDTNFWTTDAADLIIFATAEDIYGSYIKDFDSEARMQVKREREFGLLFKKSLDLAGPLIIQGRL